MKNTVNTQAKFRTDIAKCMNEFEALYLRDHGLSRLPMFWLTAKLPILLEVEQKVFGNGLSYKNKTFGFIYVARWIFIEILESILNVMALLRYYILRPKTWFMDSSSSLVVKNGQAYNRYFPASKQDDSVFFIEVGQSHQTRLTSILKRKGTVYRMQRSLGFQWLLEKILLRKKWIGVLAQSWTRHLNDYLKREGVSSELDVQRIKRILTRAYASHLVGTCHWRVFLFFFRCPPQKLFYISSYSPMSVALACTVPRQKLKLIELQHGVIGAHHPGYALDENKYDQRVLSDEFWLFGRGWMGEFNSRDYEPFTRRKVRTYGVPWYKHLAPETSIKKGLKVLVTSQEVLRDDFNVFLEEWFAHCFAQQEDIQFVLRAHPNDTWARKKCFSALAKKYAFVDVDHSGMGFVDQLKNDFTHHCSVFSTCLYEANALGVMNVVPNVTYHWNASEFIQKGGAVLIESDTDLKKISPQVDLHFFEPFELHS